MSIQVANELDYYRRFPALTNMQLPQGALFEYIDQHKIRNLKELADVIKKFSNKVIQSTLLVYPLGKNQTEQLSIRFSYSKVDPSTSSLKPYNIYFFHPSFNGFTGEQSALYQRGYGELPTGLRIEIALNAPGHNQGTLVDDWLNLLFKRKDALDQLYPSSHKSKELQYE